MNDSTHQVALNTAIIGAGIAGLAAAIALRRVGRKVTVYERSSFKDEVGAAINMPPQATKILKARGIELPTHMDASRGNEAGHGTILRQTRRVNFKTAQAIGVEAFDDIPERFGAPFVSYHRADLHTALRMKAEDLGATIRLGCPVRDIDCQNGDLFISDNEKSFPTHKYDLLVVADGIKTSFVPHVVGHDTPLKRNGRCCFRTLLPIEKILADPVARKFYEREDGTVTGYDGLSGTANPQTGIYFIAYLCRDGKLMNLAVFDRPRADRVEKGDWNTPAAISDALQPLEGFNDAFKALVKCAGSLKAFTLADRDPLPTYVNGRAVMVGDAAHPMLPTLAGGGSTSLEDAATLSALLLEIPDAEVDTISPRLALFKALRLPRDATQQILSTAMFKTQPASAFNDEISFFYTGQLPGTMLGGWNRAACELLCSYDVFEETEKAKKWAEQRGWREVEKLPDGLVEHFGPVVQ